MRLLGLVGCCALALAARTVFAAGPCCPAHGVEWPELAALGEVAVKVDAAIEQSGTAVSMVSDVQAAVTKAAKSTMPKQAKRPLEVKFLLGDLERYAAGLTKQPDQLKGFHQRVDELLNLAGVGHHHPAAAHDHDHDHDHPHGDHGHGTHGLPEGPHHGWLVPLVDDRGHPSGHLEIKLHDDAGDLEAWVTRPDGPRMALSLDTKIELRFPGLDNRVVTLQVRDRKHNPDESGASRIVAGKTDYFVYPGTTGADASWLKGRDFRQPVEATLVPAGLRTGRFELVPHVH